MAIIIFLIPLLPFLGFLILGLGSRIMPKKATSIIGPGTILLSFILSIIVFIIPIMNIIIFGNGVQ